MKNKKKLFGVIAALLVIVLCGILMSQCGKESSELGNDTETVSSQNTEVAKGDVEKDTEKVAETEAIESTEETEETEDLPEEAENSLKEEEEILVIHPMDDSVNNGNGNSGSEVYEAPAAATAENPIVKVATGDVPVTFSSGKVPAGKTLYYKVTATKGNYICISDKNAYIIYNDKKYNADESGRVLLEIQEDVSTIAIGNKTKSGQSFMVSIVGEPGSKSNPDLITIETEKEKVTPVVTSLAKDDTDGYYYSWTAEKDAIVDFSVPAETGDLTYDLVITVNGVTTTMSETGVWNADGTVTASVTVAKGDEVSICVIAIKAADNTYPAMENASFEAWCRPFGSEENPYVVDALPEDGLVTSKAVEAGSTLYYTVSGVSEMVLTIEDKTAYIIYNGTKYTADKNGIVNVEMGVLEGAATFQLGNSSKSGESTYEMQFAYPVGSEQNPIELESSQIPGTITIEVPAGETVYYASYNIGGMGLTISGEGVSVLHQGHTYEAVDNVVSFTLATAVNRQAVSFGVTNTSTSDKKYTLTLVYLEGTYNNPVTIEAGITSHTFAAGEECYYYQWTAPANGTMVFDISGTTDIGWQYSISNEEKGIADYSDTTGNVPSRSYSVEKDEVYIIKVGTYEAEASTTPAGTINFTISFSDETNAASEMNVTTNSRNGDLEENTEASEIVEVENTEEVEAITETMEPTEDVEIQEAQETVETVKNPQPMALRAIWNWCIRLFSK